MACVQCCVNIVNTASGINLIWKHYKCFLPYGSDTNNLCRIQLAEPQLDISKLYFDYQG